MTHYCKECFDYEPSRLVLIPGYEAFCMCRDHLGNVADDLEDWQVENAIPLTDYVVVEEVGSAGITPGTADFMRFEG